MKAIWIGSMGSPFRQRLQAQVGAGGLVLLATSSLHTEYLHSPLVGQARLLLFTDLIEEILDLAGRSGAPLSAADARYLLSQSIKELASEFDALGPLAHLPGLPRSLYGLWGELRRAGWGAGAYAQWAQSQRGLDRDLARVFLRQESRTLGEGLWEAEDRVLVARDWLQGASQPLGQLGFDALYLDGFSDLTPVQAEVITRLLSEAREAIVHLEVGRSREWTDQLVGVLSPYLPEREENLMPGAPPQLRRLTPCDPRQEGEWVAKEIGALLREGEIESAEDVLILMRDLGGVQPVRDALEMHSIPISRGESLKLGSLPSVQASLSLLRAFIDPCDLQVVEDLLRWEFLEFPQGIGPAQFARVRSQLGRFRHRSFFDQWAPKLPGQEGRLVREGLEQFWEHVQPLTPSPMGELLRVWVEGIRAFGFEERLLQRIQRAVDDPELASMLLGDLAGLRRLLGWAQEWSLLSSPVEPVEALRLVEDWVCQESITLPQPEGGVRIMGMAEARGVESRVAFLLNLTEGEVPRPFREDWVYPDRARRELARQGLNLETAGSHAGREEWYLDLALSRAKTVYLSRPVRDDLGKETFPAPCLYTLWESAQGALSRPEEIMGSREWERAAIRAGYPPGADVERAIHLARMRQQGVCQMPSQAVAQIQEAYGPDKVWSASMLETYARCPFQFLAKYLLKVEAVEEPGVLPVPLEKGQVLHDTLYGFYQEYLGREVGSEELLSGRERIMEIADQVLGTLAQTRPTYEPLLLALEKQEIQEILERVLKLDASRPSRWSPVFLEMGFGRPDPLVLQRGEPIKFAGRVDRIDRLASGEYLLFDYKTSFTDGKRRIRDGLALQVGIYLSLLPQMIPGEWVGGGYYSLSQGEWQAGIWGPGAEALGVKKTLSQEEIAATLEETELRVREMIERIRRGEFPAQPTSTCGYCSYGPLCRYTGYGGDEDADS